MKPNLGRIAGVLILIIAVTIGVWWKVRNRETQPVAPVASGPAVVLSGKVGGEKVGFLEDAEIQNLLARSGLSLTLKKAGSVDMVKEPVNGLNFLWPASPIDLERFRVGGGSAAQAEELLSSPLVFYSWDFVTEALLTNHIVEKVGDIYFLADLPKLVALIDEKTKWKDVGLPQFYTSILIQSTDPARSNSGNMWAALLANTYNGGEVLTPDKADAIIPRVKTFFARVGFMEAGSGTLFDKFLKQGPGAYPIIVAYENQLLEFAHEHPELVEPVRKRLRVVYPRPTVWASHPLIALDGNSKRLIQALKDPAIQRIAWERHGFRSGLMGGVSTNSLPIMGIPATIDGIMQIPNLAVMEKLTEALAGGNTK